MCVCVLAHCDPIILPSIYLYFTDSNNQGTMCILPDASDDSEEEMPPYESSLSPRAEFSVYT